MRTRSSKRQIEEVFKVVTDATSFEPDFERPDLQIGLMTHQKQGVGFMQSVYESHSCGGMITDEMGSGKSIMALTTAVNFALSSGAPTLVVLPPTLIQNWDKEARTLLRKSPSLKDRCEQAITILRYGSLMERPPAGCFIVIAPNTLFQERRKPGSDEEVEMPPILTQTKWGLVIVDECHDFLRNPNSKQYKAFTSSRIECQQIWALSGTPFKSGTAKELDTLAKGLRLPSDVLLQDVTLRRTRGEIDPEYATQHVVRERQIELSFTNVRELLHYDAVALAILCRAQETREEVGKKRKQAGRGGVVAIGRLREVITCPTFGDTPFLSIVSHVLDQSDVLLNIFEYYKGLGLYKSRRALYSELVARVDGGEVVFAPFDGKDVVDDDENAQDIECRERQLQERAKAAVCTISGTTMSNVPQAIVNDKLYKPKCKNTYIPSNKYAEVLRLYLEATSVPPKEGELTPKFLVFSESVEACTNLVAFLESHSIVARAVTGKVNRMDRCSFTNAFENQDCTVLVMTTRVGGQGLNLGRATHVIFLSPSTQPLQDAQNIGRANRINGPLKDIVVVWLITKQSIDEQTWRSAARNAENLCTATNGMYLSEEQAAKRNKTKK